MSQMPAVNSYVLTQFSQESTESTNRGNQKEVLYCQQDSQVSQEEQQGHSCHRPTHQEFQNLQVNMAQHEPVQRVALNATCEKRYQERRWCPNSRNSDLDLLEACPTIPHKKTNDDSDDEVEAECKNLYEASSDP